MLFEYVWWLTGILAFLFSLLAWMNWSDLGKKNPFLALMSWPPLGFKEYYTPRGWLYVKLSIATVIFGAALMFILLIIED